MSTQEFSGKWALGLIIAILFAFLIAALICPKPFDTARFVITIGVVLFCILAIIFSTIMFIIYPTPDRPMYNRIVELLIASFLSSLIYYVGLLPFLILLFSHPFWRKRFDAVFGNPARNP